MVIMIDTVKLWIDSSTAGNIDLFAVANCLTNVSEHSYEHGFFTSGTLKNCKVNIHATGISIIGSLAKYYFGDNLQTLTRSGVEQAIQNMSDELHLPICKAKLNQIDLATHFITKYPAFYYYSLLGDKKYFKRLQATKDTLYYNTWLKQLVFYDKGLEAQSKNVKKPPIYQNVNLLRYELRHKGRLNKQFNLTEVSGATLYQERFYIDLINRWIKEYMNIQKIKRLTITNIETVKTPNDALEMIFGILLCKSGLNDVDYLISDLKARKTFTDPKYYSRVKSKIKELMNNPEITDNSDLINELDRNVKEIKRYYR